VVARHAPRGPPLREHRPRRATGPRLLETANRGLKAGVRAKDPPTTGRSSAHLRSTDLRSTELPSTDRPITAPLTWDPRDEQSRPVADGIYFAMSNVAGRTLPRPILVLR
jgi:hypothetical protein